jgi:regulator of protease activity HflC (stomatin/prohibitin superfamily)
MSSVLSINVTTITIIIVALYLLSSIKILKEYERGVIFRLGRVLPRAKGPGIIWYSRRLIVTRISLRIEALVPAQDVIARQRDREGERGDLLPRD